MNETHSISAAQNPASGEYQQVLHWTVKDNRSRAIWIQTLTIPVFLLLGAAFSFLAVHLGNFPETSTLGPLQFGAVLAGIGAVPAGIVTTILLHELAHGLTMRLCGAKPQYGVLWKQLMFYATSPGYGFRRNSYILMLLAPLVGLSCLAIIGMLLLRGTNWVALLALCATINGSGAFGDVWLVSLALRYPQSAYVVDEKDGIRVFIRKA
jgi:hypothetical protein